MPKNGVTECRQWARGIMGKVLYTQMRKLKFKKKKERLWIWVKFFKVIRLWFRLLRVASTFEGWACYIHTSRESSRTHDKRGRRQLLSSRHVSLMIAFFCIHFKPIKTLFAVCPSLICDHDTLSLCQTERPDWSRTNLEPTARSVVGGERVDLKARGFKKRVLIFMSRIKVHEVKEGWSNRFLGQMFTGVLMRCRSSKFSNLSTYSLVRYG